MMPLPAACAVGRRGALHNRLRHFSTGRIAFQELAYAKLAGSPGEPMLRLWRQTFWVVGQSREMTVRNGERWAACCPVRF